MSDTIEEEVIVANAVLGGDENYEEIEQAIDPAKLGDKLVQVNNKKGTVREFQIYDETQMLVSEREVSGDKIHKYRVNLAWVSAEPKHNKLIDWNWLYVALVLAAITSSFVILAVMQRLTLDYAMIGGTITFTLTALASMIFVYRMHDEFIFTGFYGGAELFLMENKRPTQQLFDMFFVKLQQSIDRSKQQLSVNDRLVGELKMCRRLRDEGVLDEQAYTSTRTHIFKHEQYQA